MTARLMTASIELSESEGVERATPDGPPTAFRIWRAGVNPTDFGDHVFSEASAALLMAEQQERGNLYSVDVDHLSLSKGKDAAPPESRKGVGFHRLAVRPSPTGPELWAVDCEWTDAVRPGLEKKPPEWRYFSPAYRLRKDSTEIVSYLNTALTNNPATHFVTELATREIVETSMDYKAMATAFFSDDDKKREEAKKAYASMNDDEKKAFKAAWKAASKDFEDGPADKQASEGGDDADKKKKEEEATKASESEKAKKVAADEECRRQAAARPTDNELKLAQRVDLLEADIQRRVAADRAAAEASERQAVFAKRPDIGETMRASLASLPVADLKKFVETLPRVAALPGSSTNAMLAGGRVSGSERNAAGNPTIGRLSADERTMLTTVHTKNAAPTGEVVRATRQGSVLEMPMYPPTPVQAAARIKELEGELAAHRAEVSQ